MRRLGLLLASLAALLLAPPTLGWAAVTTTVDFEAVPVGAFIRDQYAGVGVSFGTPDDFGLPPAPKMCGGPSAFAPGISGTSGAISCRSGPVEFPFDRRFGTAFEFSFEQRSVSFALSYRDGPDSTTALISTYGVGGILLTQQSVALSAGANVTVPITRGVNEIAGVVISGALPNDFSGRVLLDTIVASRDDVPATPKFTLALPTPSIEVVEGATGEVPVGIRRFNGSFGPVSLSVAALPAGIVATQFTPNPATGLSSALRITLGRPLKDQRQVSVSASGGGTAGTGVGTAKVQSVTAIPAITIAEGGRFPLRLVPGCGPRQVNDSFSVRGGYTGVVTARAANATGGLTASVVTPRTAIGANGNYPVTFSLDPGVFDGSGTFDFEAEPEGATRAVQRITWITDRVSFVRATTLSTPRPIVPGSRTVGIVGNFPAACAVTFQDRGGLTWTERSRTQIDEDGRLLDLITLDVPTAAVSSPLRVLSPTGVELSTTRTIEVTDYRNVYGLSQANSGSGAGAADYTWGEFERTFGTDDTDACFIVCVRDPVASDYYDTFRAGVRSNGGLCAGWSIMSLRFRGFGGVEQTPASYQPGVRRAWQIAPVVDGTPAKTDVVRWHVAQNDKSFAKARADSLNRSPADELAVLKELIARQGGAYIRILQGGAGHAIVAYAVREDGAGPVQVSVYDSNTPYTTAEETSSVARGTALGNSTISIDSGGNWSGTSLGWSGPNNTLGVVSAIPPPDGELPSNFSLLSLFDSSAGGGGPPAKVTGITTGGQPALTPSGVPVAGRGVTLDPVDSGVGALPEYQLAPGREYTLAVRGTRAGTYTHGLLGLEATASVKGARTAPGQVDQLEIRPGQAQIAFATGGGNAPVAFALNEKAGKVTRSATVATTARRGVQTETELARGTLLISQAGPPTTATITLGSVGAGLPGSVTTAPVRIGRGERVELTPRSWSDIGAGVRFVARNASGRILRRGTVRLVTTKQVALGGLTARRAGSTLTVSGRVTKRGTAPLLAIVAEVVKGGKVVRRISATRRGGQVTARSFAIPLTLGSVPKGTQVRVRATLLDEAAGLASVRRVLTLRA